MSSLDKPANPEPGAATTPPTDEAGARRAAGDPGTSKFPPGSVFAGRYRMITRIGRGGMGEVWRADDLVLQTTVALKLLTSGSREGRGRILNEVRLARQVTHPAVCRVFDVGDADGELFYTMELVDGEDLASVLARLGRLPLEKVLDIARQLCAGLAAAHAQGVLHRDLKPANVLIDARGRVRITDFGIAITRDRAGDHTPFGTPAYMAPEQFEPGTPLSERTDIYALGVVLYELLVGQRPRRLTSGAPDSPSFAGEAPSSGLPVDSRFERVLLRCLSPDPRQRPASASEVLASLPTGLAHAEPPPRRRLWIRGAAILAVIVLAAVLGSRLFRTAPAVLTNQDVIVLADVLNTTGDPVFDGTLKVALAVALEQSPFLKVFSDDRVRDTLALMQRPPGERVTRPVAREIAQREGLTALIAGSIAPLGANYVIALEAIDAESADVMAREQVEARGKEQVLTALGTAASQLREKLGESLGSIQRFDVPLPRATTPSLEALHAYALALDQGRVVPRAEAIPHLERAVALDPDFALALALLSGVYANTGRSADAPPFARRAFELRDRVSERERFFISWRYHLDAEQAWDDALDLAQSWTTTYPREAFAFNSLGLASAAFGQHDRAVDAFREAIRLDERFVPPHGNLAGSLIALNRFDEAKTRLGEAAAHGVAFITLRRMAWVLAFMAGDRATAAQELALTRRSPEAVWASVWEARAAAFAGRFAEAHDLFQRSAETARRENAQELAAQWTVEDAEAHAIAGQCAEARREVNAGIDLGRDNFTLERASRTLALCGDAGGVLRLTDELRRRFANATITTRVQLPVTGAALALGQDDAARALTILDPVAPYDRAPAAEFWPVYLRGQAHLRLKDGPAAAAQFQRIVDARGSAPTSPLYVLAHLGLARAVTLGGDIAAARQGYERLLALWAEADATLGPLADARREYARLQ